MTEMRSWSLPEQHLMPDAVVAFVDGELSALAHDRAAEHISKCPFCATETRTQRQARSAVRDAGDPGTPASLLAALRAIPIDTELPGGPDNLAVGPDGQLVAIQRPERVAGLGGSPMMGSSRPLGSGLGAGLGNGATVLRHHRRPSGRRAVQGAGVVIGGLVLGALVVVGPHVFGGTTDAPTEPPVNGAGLANVPIGSGGDARVTPAVGQYAADSTPVTTSPKPTTPTVIPVVNSHHSG
jgi:anti-sigma factor RsiW